MEKGLSRDKIKEISSIKNEQDWMLNFRLQSYEKFKELSNPIFGPDLNIDFDSINYYKKVSDKIANDWNDVDKDIKDTFDKIGLPEAEKKYLDAVHAQYESESIYHNMIKELEEKNVIFCDTDTGLREHPEIFKEYFNNLVK